MGPIPPLPAYWWKFDNNFNDSVDASPFNPAPGNTLAFNPLLRIDAQTHELVNLGASANNQMNSSFTGAGSFSLAFWFKTSEIGDFDLMFDTGAPCGLMIYKQGIPAYLNFYLNNGAAPVNYMPVPDGNFNHYAITVGPLYQFAAYLNGIFYYQVAVTSTVWSGSPFNVGGPNPGAKNAQGPFELDSARFYASELTPTQILNIYASEIPV